MTTKLVSALSAYALTEEDLPGVAEAWNTMFGVLEHEAPETEVQALVRMNPGLAEWTDVTVESLNPHADGSLTVHYEGRRPADDEDDEWHTLDESSCVLNPEQAREFLLARENRPNALLHRRLAREVEEFVTGKRAIWWLLADDGAEIAREVHHAQTAVWSAASRLEDRERTLRLVDQLRDALETATPLPRENEKDYPTVVGYARGVKPLSSATEKDRWGADTRAVRFDEVNRVATTLRTAIPEAERLRAAFDGASALPDGPLRTYLLAERDRVYYDSTEGTGRKAKTVKRSYLPASDLVKEHAAAVKKHAEADTERKALLRKLSVTRREYDAQVKALTKEIHASQKTLDEAWAAGFPGKNAPERVEAGPSSDW